MADFHAEYDTLPAHSHGSISVHDALLMLYEETGDRKYLKRVTDRWIKVVSEGYISPAGGVLEHYTIAHDNRDEGCAESDWLRLNLSLWRETGETRYLEMAERLLWNEYLANQWPDGGYGHRHMSTDARGVYAFGTYSEEAVWCCCFNGPLGLRELKSYLAVGSCEGIYYNFLADFKAPVLIGKNAWVVTSKTLSPPGDVPVRCEVTLSGTGSVPVMVRIPDWAYKVIIQSDGKTIPAIKTGGYLRTAPVSPGTRIEIVCNAQPHLEDRRGERIAIPNHLPAKLDDVVVRQGPGILLNDKGGNIENVALNAGRNGSVELSKGASTTLVPWIKIKALNIPHAMVFNVTLTAPLEIPINGANKRDNSRPSKRDGGIPQS